MAWGNARNRTKPKSSESTFLDDVLAINNHPELRELYNNGDYQTWYKKRDELEGLAQRKITRLNALGEVFQLANRILSNTDVNVRITTDSVLEAHAWSDGTSIYLNADMLDDPTDTNIVALRGVNYHELGHIIYTPRAGSELVKTVMEKRLWTVMNILEDNRVETLITALYPATIPYLTTTFLRYVLEGTKDHTMLGRAFPLSRGRKFLPIELRQAIADSFIAEHGSTKAKKVASIIDEYRLLVLPRQSDRALELICELAELIEITDDPQDGEGGEGQNGEGKVGKGKVEVMGSKCSDHPPMKNGRIASTKQQDEVIKSAERADSASENENLDEPNKGGAGANSNKERNGDTDPPQDDERISDELIQKINELIDKTIKAPDVKEDIKRLKDVLREGTSEGERTIKVADYSYRNVEVIDAVTAEQFSEELQRLQIDADPQWEYEVSSGKLNIQRVMNFDPTKVGIAFDRWSEGNEGAFDMETAILVDNSGSMLGEITQALRSTWVIKRALDAINASNIVYTFSTRSKILYDKGELADPRKIRTVSTDNSTNPIEALREVERTMLASHRKSKMVFIITDGQWDNDSAGNAIISRLQDMGVVVVVVYLGDLTWLENREPQWISDYINAIKHGADIFYTVSQASQITELARRIVLHVANNRYR